jgi:deoxycytidine triphosphate deaminase
MDAGHISIDPFHAERLGPTSYRICPYRLRFNVEDEEGLRVPAQVSVLSAGKERELRSGEYAIVSPEEKISLSEGFVADFFPSSWCIENKLLITAGRLDTNYSADLVFGIFNAGRSDVILSNSTQLLRVTFGWLGSDNMPVYRGQPPGAYIPELNKLRARDADLEQAEAEIQRKRKEIRAALEALEKKESKN